MRRISVSSVKFRSELRHFTACEKAFFHFFAELVPYLHHRYLLLSFFFSSACRHTLQVLLLRVPPLYTLLEVPIFMALRILLSHVREYANYLDFRHFLSMGESDLVLANLGPKNIARVTSADAFIKRWMPCKGLQMLICHGLSSEADWPLV